MKREYDYQLVAYKADGDTGEMVLEVTKVDRYMEKLLSSIAPISFQAMYRRPISRIEVFVLIPSLMIQRHGI